MKLSTELSIQPKYWDAKRHRPKRSFTHYARFSALLDKYERLTREVYLDLTMTVIPSTKGLRDEIVKRFHPPAPVTVAGYAATFLINRPDYKLKTRQAYSRVSDLIGEYNSKATFEQIDMDFMSGFKDFLYKKGYEQNSAAKIYQRFKSIITDATDRGINTNLKYRTRKVSINYIDTTKVFLDENEIEKLWRLQGLTPTVEAVKDAFIVSCYTGVRFSDIWKINESAFKDIEGTKHFLIVDTKNDQSVQIPVHPLVLTIMQKYQWNIPRISNVKFNLHLKAIGEAAGIDTPTVVTNYPGGKRKDELVSKFALITAHTGRRSLICNLYLAEVPTETIKKISGHRSHSAFLKYLRLTPQEHLSIAYRSNFFKGKLKVV